MLPDHSTQHRRWSLGSTNRWILPAAGLVVLVLAIVLIVALCSGGGDDGDQSAGGLPTATESTEDEGGGEETSEPTTEQEEDAAAALQDLSGAYEGATARVTYDFTSLSFGQSTTGTMILYSDPPNARTDHKNTSTGETISFISKGDQSFVCTEGQCFAYPVGAAVNPIPFVSQYAEPGAINSIVAGVAGVDVQTTEEEIAGIDARCFHLASAGADLTWCFGDDGLLLLGASKSADVEFEMRATEVNRNVADADFEPPFPVTEFPQ